MQIFKGLAATIFLLSACSSTIDGSGDQVDDLAPDARLPTTQFDAANPIEIDAAVPQVTTLSQGTGAPVPNANVNCRYGELGPHAATQHFRIFPAASIGGSTITEASFPIEVANAPGGTQTATLKLHKLTGDILSGEFQLVSEIPFNVPNQTLGEVKIPLDISVAANDSIVIEVAMPDGARVQNLRFGHNLEAQTGKTYYASTDCGQTLPIDLASLDNPFVQGTTFAAHSWLFSLTIER